MRARSQPSLEAQSRGVGRTGRPGRLRTLVVSVMLAVAVSVQLSLVAQNATRCLTKQCQSCEDDIRSALFDIRSHEASGPASFVGLEAWSPGFRTTWHTQRRQLLIYRKRTEELQVTSQRSEVIQKAHSRLCRPSEHPAHSLHSSNSIRLLISPPLACRLLGSARLLAVLRLRLSTPLGVDVP